MFKMKKKIIIGVMGPGKVAGKQDIDNALLLGELIAEQGWFILSGGMKSGVMGAVNQGAKKKNGFTIGILPNNNLEDHSPNLDMSIITNMGGARNYINSLSCNIMVACGMNAGTSSEVSFAIQENKPIILLGTDVETNKFFQKMGGSLVHIADTPKMAIELITKLLNGVK